MLPRGCLLGSGARGLLDILADLPLQALPPLLQLLNRTLLRELVRGTAELALSQGAAEQLLKGGKEGSVWSCPQPWALPHCACRWSGAAGPGASKRLGIKARPSVSKGTVEVERCEEQGQGMETAVGGQRKGAR